MVPGVLHQIDRAVGGLHISIQRSGCRIAQNESPGPDRSTRVDHAWFQDTFGRVGKFLLGDALDLQFSSLPLVFLLLGSGLGEQFVEHLPLPQLVEGHFEISYVVIYVRLKGIVRLDLERFVLGDQLLVIALVIGLIEFCDNFFFKFLEFDQNAPPILGLWSLGGYLCRSCCFSCGLGGHLCRCFSCGLGSQRTRTIALGHNSGTSCLGGLGRFRELGCNWCPFEFHTRLRRIIDRLDIAGGYVEIRSFRRDYLVIILDRTKNLHLRPRVKLFLMSPETGIAERASCTNPDVIPCHRPDLPGRV